MAIKFLNSIYSEVAKNIQAVGFDCCPKTSYKLHFGHRKPIHLVFHQFSEQISRWAQSRWSWRPPCWKMFSNSLIWKHFIEIETNRVTIVRRALSSTKKLYVRTVDLLIGYACLSFDDKRHLWLFYYWTLYTISSTAHQTATSSRCNSFCSISLGFSVVRLWVFLVFKNFDMWKTRSWEE